MPQTYEERQQSMAIGGLSHLIGAYYLLGSIMCKCNPRDDPHMRQILLHMKGIYWSLMEKKYGISNPKRDDPMRTREL